MQSGISASQELHTAFNTFVSDPTQRALLAGINNEALVPFTTLPLKSSLGNDLDNLQQHLSDTAATYILLKLEPDQSDGYAAVTFVPNAAPVRQKMLFASTRLTLVRELGIERFRETLFATEKSELTAEGWRKHQASSALKAPLTEEESLLGGVKEAEAAESQGTGARRGHVSQTLDVKVANGVVDALRSLEQSGTLVQLKYALPDETLRLDSRTQSVSPSSLSSKISSSEPRYSFYSHLSSSSSEPVILFIYTCPTSSKVKERMIYSTGKRWTSTVAERDAGIKITKSLEATEPSDITEEMLAAELGEEQKTETKTFARPKRPGRR